MHEQSLVKTLLEQVERIRRGHAAARISEVRVEVGPLSGVEPLLLASAFEQLAPGSTAAGARLVIDEVTLRAQCESCGCRFEVQDFFFRCPQCSGNVRVTRGDAFLLVSVSLSEPRQGTGESSQPNSCESDRQQEVIP